MRPMHLLFLADAVSQDIAGGSRTVAYELARELLRRNHQITFLVAHQKTGTPDDEIIEGMRVIRYLGAGDRKRFVQEGEVVAQKLRAETKIDLVHTHFAYAATGPLRALSGIPHVRSFYGPWHEESLVEDKTKLANLSGRKRLVAQIKMPLAYHAKKKIEQKNIQLAQNVVVLSQQSVGEVLYLGYPQEKIHIVPAGADIHRFTLGDKNASRTHLNLPQDSSILFTIRRLVPRMGIDNLITAMTEVVKKHPDILLLIGGRGPQKETLEAQIEALGLAQNIRLVGFVSGGRSGSLL